MKRLFAVLDTQNNKIVEDQYFQDKESAKKVREELNGGKNVRYIVTPGPDHHKYRG